ncbi:MAG: CaiB/BaiF CoA transferase family protein [Promethearchaeota archaeon]
MNLPLKGIIVLDLTRFLPGPFCTMLLGDLGAEIIRIEDPKFPYNSFPPYFSKGEIKKSVLSTILMRNKKSVVLDLKKEAARKIFFRLAAKANVIIEGFRPGKVKSLGIDYSTLKKKNPSLIYCSLSGYGQNGPLSSKAGHDLNYLALSGNLNLNSDGCRPIVPGFQMADISGSFYATIAILSALFSQMTSFKKKGEYIDISILDACFSINPVALMHEFAGESADKNILSGNYAFYQIYETMDGKFISVAAIEEKFWNQLCKALELQEFQGNQYGSKEYQQQLITIISQKFKSKTQKEWIKIFENFDACVTPVQNYRDAIQNPHIIEENLIKEFEDPNVGLIPYLSLPFRFSSLSLRPPGPAPLKGEHTVSILKRIGFSDIEIEEFKKNGSFG